MHILMPQLAVAGTAGGSYGYSWMRATVRSRKDAERAKTNPREELRMYLESPLEDVQDVVLWWGVSLMLTLSCFCVRSDVE